jgi:AcrR family transcriptional regulator
MSQTSASTQADLPLSAALSLAVADGELPASLPRHRHGLSREVVRASQELRIVVATAEMVAEKGYAATTVAAIVERAGVSSKTFYELYADREEAFLATYAVIHEVIERIVDASLAHDDPRAMLRAGTRAFLETLAAEPAFARTLVIEAVGAGPRVLARRAEAFDEFVRVLALPLQLARAADPSLPECSDALLLGVCGGILELVLQHLVAHDAASLPQLAPTIDELVERACLTPRV